MSRYVALPLSAHDFFVFLLLTALVLIVLVSFIALLVSYATNSLATQVPREKELAKLIGGLTLLMIALSTGNPWLMFTSFFIGGLLIASERFMVVLAAILNSDRKNVHKIPSFYDLAPTEIEEKHDEEVETSLSNERDETVPPAQGMENPISSTAQNETSTAQLFADRRKEITEREKILLNNFENNIRRKFPAREVTVKRYVRVTGEFGPVSYDSLLIQPQTNKILLGVEIMHLSSMKLNFTRRAIETALRRYKQEFPLLISVIFSEYSPEVAAELVRYKNKIKKTAPDVGIIFYQMEGEKVESVNDEDLAVFLESVIHQQKEDETIQLS